MPLWNAPQATVAEVEAAQATADQALADAALVWTEVVFIVNNLGPTVSSMQVIAPVTGSYVTTSVVGTAQPSNSATATPTIDGVAVTNGAATLLSTDLAGTVRTATATGANDVTALTTAVLITVTSAGSATTYRLTVMCGFRRS